jgi:hypothetical protein
MSLDVLVKNLFSRAWILGWGLIAVATALTLAIRPVTPPSDQLGLRRFRVPIDMDTAVSQTFTMTADGFHALEFQPAAVGNGVSGRVRFELEERGSGVVRSGEMSAADLLSSSSYRLEFAPIDDSKDSVYRLELMSSGNQPATGIAVWATKGWRYAEGAMQINGRERWADLAFRTFAPAGRSTWERLTSMQSPPPGVSPRNVILASLSAYLLASGFVLRAFWRWHQ